MLRKAFLGVRARPKRTLLCLTLLASAAMNALAYRHAWLMTHFVGVGDRPPSPEVMTLWQKAEAALCGVQIPKPRNAETPADYDLPFEVHRFATSDGLKCEAWRVPCADGQRQRAVPVVPRFCERQGQHAACGASLS